MHERYRNHNIPIELLRTLVAITETRSFTKAAGKLSLTQPAISAQVRRLQSIVGGPLFEKAGGGTSLNERGKLVISYVHKLLDANDRILSLAGGGVHHSRQIRVGISSLYFESFMDRFPFEATHGVQIYCDQSDEIAKGIIDGYIDIGCGPFQTMPSVQNRLAEWTEKLTWVRGSDFLLSPGAPVPLVSWPNMIADRIAIQALEERGIRYNVVVTSPVHHARVAAVASGVGVMAQVDRTVDPLLRPAAEYYLPELPPLHVGVFAQDTVEREAIGEYARMLMSLAPPQSSHARPDHARPELKTGTLQHSSTATNSKRRRVHLGEDI